MRMCGMMDSHVCIASVTCVAWLIPWDDACYIDSCDVPPVYVRQELFLLVTWWRAFFMCVAWLILISDMIHSYLRHDSFLYVTWLILICASPLCVTWTIYRQLIVCSATRVAIYTVYTRAPHKHTLSTQVSFLFFFFLSLLTHSLPFLPLELSFSLSLVLCIARARAHSLSLSLCRSLAFSLSLSLLLCVSLSLSLSLFLQSSLASFFRADSWLALRPLC